MAETHFHLNDRGPKVVGSVGQVQDLNVLNPGDCLAACDLLEIRLDLLAASRDGVPASWNSVGEIPLLFTARRAEEGGAGSLSAAERMQLLDAVLDVAACVDIEVASIDEMSPLIGRLAERQIPWIASFHHFDQLPARETLDAAAEKAARAGAAVFKAAARLHTPQDMAMLADFQLTDHGIPVATMGMGELAPVSRLLCAQCGSVLNYGYLGTIPTAPGQWDAASLKQAIARLLPIRIKE